MNDENHEDHLKYTLDQLLTNMVLLEEHFKNFKCDECRNKHLYLIAGYADEGVTMTDSEELKNLLNEIKRWADRMKEDSKNWNADELREIRRKLQSIYLSGDNKHDMEYAKIMRFEGKTLYDSGAQQVAREIIETESKKYGVPAPKIIFRENKEFCNGTSCTITDSHGRSSQIWLKPDYFSLRTILHEFYHHMATVVGPDGVKKYFPQFKGDADSEDEANLFAEREAINLQTSDLNTTANTNNNMETELVLKQGGTDVFRHLSDIYSWAEGILKVPKSDLNLEYSPEFVGRVLEDAYDYVLTPVGQAMANFITSLALMGIGTLDVVGPYDRQWLNEWAAHQLFAVLALATPEQMQSMSSTAKSMGQLMAQGKSGDALMQLTKPNIFNTLKQVTDSVQSLFTSAQPKAQRAADNASQKLPPQIFSGKGPLMG